MYKIMQRGILFLQNLSYRKKLLLTSVTVSIVPLMITTVFCYYQITSGLYQREMTALNYTLNTATDSLNSQVQLYENLLMNLSSSDTVIKTASQQYKTIYEKYEQFTYSFDVFLNSVYTQYPQVEQITLYTEQENLQHGKQLQPLSSLKEESWYPGSMEQIRALPQWFVDTDGDMVVIARVPEPYTRYIRAYSDNCIAIRIPQKSFFYFLDNLSDDCHLKIVSDKKTFFEYTAASVSKIPESNMTTITAEASNEWVLTLQKPYDLITQSANQMILVMVLIIMVCLVLIVFLSNLFSDFSVKRIDKLHRTMQQIQESGNFEIHIHDDCQDEIGQLTNNFQTMADEIRTLIQENYQNKITLKEAQLKALQAQINPHFLYNCLSLINSRALLTNQADISQMSQLMSTFYRTTLNKGRSDILLRDEIKNVLSYIEIQRLLHDNAFQVLSQIDPMLPDIYVPNLILQPLVENSIIHGILPKGISKGRLFLTIRRVDDMIHFTVMDNGVGIPAERIPLLTQTDSNGYGLKNVNERLLLTYGEGSVLKINSIQNESTMITFCIPATLDSGRHYHNDRENIRSDHQG